MQRVWMVLLLLLPVSVQANGMGEDAAQHLLSRTGFTPTPREVREFSVLSRTAAVERLLAGVRTEARTPLPPALLEFVPRAHLRELKNASEAQRKAFQREQFERSLELRTWWYREMLETDSPLTERLTLFWHNHFVSSQQKVKSPVLMARQNQLLRRHALGNFAQLLHAIAKDPAMVVYLDNVSNKRASPNENFAREVMELFTLGEGHYQEQDIKEAARAFTGWSLDRDTGEFRFYRMLHDAEEKTVLGKRGNWNGDEVLDILLAQPVTAEFVTQKLWREFISPTPDPAEVSRLASVFRKQHYDIRALMRALLLSDAFDAPQNRALLIKSPVELIVGSLHLFDIQPNDLRPLAFAARNLGQDIFAPPNVRGWPGGEVWINSTSLLGRRQVLARLLSNDETAQPEPKMNRGKRFQQGSMLAQGEDYRFDAARWFGQFPTAPAEAQLRIERAVLGTTSPQQSLAGADRFAMLQALVLDPAYQLK